MSKLKSQYTVKNVLLLNVSHVREMKGETDEVVRRTRSDEAESAVVNVVKACGVEPNWFVERWLADEGRLVVCAVFEEEASAPKFAAAITPSEDLSVRDDAAMTREVAEYFSTEWEKQHKEAIAKYTAVISDALENHRDEVGRVIVGAVTFGTRTKEEGAKEFEKIASVLAERYEKCGIEYSAHATRDLSQIVFAFALPTEDDAKSVCLEVRKSAACVRLAAEGSGIGALFGDDALAVAACVVAKIVEKGGDVAK